LALNNSFTF
jgi:hypothetical protein